MALAAMKKFWPLSDVASGEISIYDGPDVFLEQFRRAPKTEQLAFAGYWLQAEILNGGLCQFFLNDTGVLAPEAVEACRTFGLPRLATKMQEAMTWFGPKYPREREARATALKQVDDDPFSELEEEVVELIYEENSGLEQAAMEYIEAYGS